ncbi:hypothetical protein HYX10_00770 [Candidatus Woesearchaeota archaeon]|nr:hypothetical protein [Candidatus Woesearchaeota archaeon]
MKLMLMLVFLLCAIEVSAAGIGVAPAELNFNLEKGNKQQKELTIYSLEDHRINFQVSSDAEFLRFYHSGIVEGSGSEKIIVELDSGRMKAGEHEETIYITSSNGAAGVKLNLGTAVKANANVADANKLNAAAGIITSLTIVMAGLLLYFSNAVNKIMQLKARLAKWLRTE